MLATTAEPTTTARWSRGIAAATAARLYRTLDQDERDNKAVKPSTMPTLLPTAEGTLPFTRSSVQPLMSHITRAVEVPKAGLWLVDENHRIVTVEQKNFVASGAGR